MATLTKEKIYGDWYLTGAPMKPTKKERRTFDSWVWSQYKDIPCPIRFTDQQTTLAQCKKTFQECGILRVSIAYNNHPFWGESTNAMFRAIHDWHHIILNCDDTLDGEIITYLHARESAPDCIGWILRSEIVLQAAACILTGEFQPQKLVWMPSYEPHQLN